MENDQEWQTASHGSQHGDRYVHQLPLSIPQLGIKSQCSLSKFLSISPRCHRNGSKLHHMHKCLSNRPVCDILSIIIATVADRLCCHLGAKPILAETKGIRALLLSKDHQSLNIGNYQTSKK